MSALADKRLMRIVAVGLLLSVAYLVYLPGLSGGFLFDDFSNLAVLGYYGRVDTWESLWLYLLSGFSGPTGRPLSTLSFLLDANTWPAEPLPFKHTNVLIHLAVAAALYMLVREIARALDLPQSRAIRVALLSMAIWLLHPLWVSTTLYVVQRMAQLSTLFVLLGLWLYLRSRIRNPETLTWKAWLQSAAAIGGCGLLAVLSKENGALLPLLAIVLEVTVLSTQEKRLRLQASRGWAIWRLVLLGVPVAALAFYLAQSLPALLAGNPGTRSFTPGERLLAQGPILWEYISHLVLPRPQPGQLFNDHIHVPATVQQVMVALLAWGTLLILTALAVIYRTRKPVLAATFLFFMAGHVLESSFVQLELYFEHRNYLPAALMGLPLAAYLTEPTRRFAPETRVVAVIAVLAVLTALTWHRTDLWGKPFQQALAWARSAPESARAQHYLAGRWIETGNLAEASRLNQQAIRLAPREAPWLLTQVTLECAQGVDPTEAMARVEQFVREARRMNAVVREQLTQYFDFIVSDRCDSHTGPLAMLALVERLDTHPMPGALRAAMYQRAAEARLMLGEPERAYELLEASVRHMPDEGVQLRNAAILAGYGQYPLALAILDREVVPAKRSGRAIERLRREYISQAEYYQREREALRAQIIEEMEAQGSFHLTKEHGRTNQN